MTAQRAYERPNDPLVRHWGLLLKTHREKAGLTQNELDARLTPPVQQSTVGRWETGKREPRLARKRQLAEVLETTVSDLFPGEEIPVS